MKLCPQCDFIYEDDQRFCDMDGKELVHNPAPVVIEASIAGPSSRTPERLPGRQSRSFAVAVLTVVVLTALVIAVYFARARQTRSSAASESATHSAERSAPQPSAQSTSEATVSQPQASGLVSTETPATAASPEPSREKSAELSSAQTDLTTLDSSPSRTSLSHARLPANPVSTKGPSGNTRGPVIVRLNNGASIKADEAWEKKEGIWYRQAGMVTFLKRSRVRTIERSAPPVRSKSAATNEEKNTATQKQLRLARLEPVAEKKQSRVTSFLKKTGRFLKRPFKF